MGNVGVTALVTGATGFTGQVLVRKLIAQGIAVRAIARPGAAREPLADLPVTWHLGNVYDPLVVAEAASGVDYIFHVAAAFREAKIPDEEYYNVHVASTKLLVEAVCGQATFKRFVHVSTMGVHGHIERPPGNESSPFAPGDEYQRTKAEAEQWLGEYAKQHRFPYTIIRPTGIFGPGDKRLFKVFKMAKWPVFPVLGNGPCLYHLIHVDDLTDAIILAAKHPAAAGEAFLIGNDTAISIIDMAKLVCSLLGKRLHVLRLPAGPFFMLAAICEAVCRPFGIEPPLYRRRVAFYTKDRSFDTSKARNLLQFVPQHSNEEGILQTAAWYIEHGWLKSERPIGPAALTASS